MRAFIARELVVCIHEGFVSRQLPAALDRYLTALPAMSLVPVAPFLSAQPRCCGLHIAQDEPLGARERRLRRAQNVRSQTSEVRSQPLTLKLRRAKEAKGRMYTASFISGPPLPLVTGAPGRR